MSAASQSREYCSFFTWIWKVFNLLGDCFCQSCLAGWLKTHFSQNAYLFLLYPVFNFLGDVCCLWSPHLFCWMCIALNFCSFAHIIFTRSSASIFPGESYFNPQKISGDCTFHLSNHTQASVPILWKKQSSHIFLSVVILALVTAKYLLTKYLKPTCLLILRRMTKLHAEKCTIQYPSYSTMFIFCCTVWKWEQFKYFFTNMTCAYL